MNTWNEFRYNAAVGAGTCGACYWMPPANISGPSKLQTWKWYAAMQSSGRAGAVPMSKFIGNSCSAAMTAIPDRRQHSLLPGGRRGWVRDARAARSHCKSEPHAGRRLSDDGSRPA